MPHVNPKQEAKHKATPEQVQIRENRNKARALLERRGLVKKGDGKQVDHKDGNPLNNNPDNLRVLSAKKNESLQHGPKSHNANKSQFRKFRG
jgi:HNH endonuclease